uniref:ribosomal protein L32 n=1 Tax=Juncus bufonius TaxID=223656 RepID=UPI001F137A7E|nr:ribosomal protein L32 [Juncus bufonius]ULQ66667.1 ribosomal protein L32 [Juncus bufonius]
MAVPKKRTSISKKRIRRNIWIKKGYLITKKASKLNYMRKPKRYKINSRVFFSFANFVRKLSPAIDVNPKMQNIK